jgi:hypothetical protein
MPNPLTNPKAFDFCILGGVVSPGLCDILDAKSKRKIDVVRGFGLSGATLVYHGTDPIEFRVRLRLSTPEEIDFYNDVFSKQLAAPVGINASLGFVGGAITKAPSFYHSYLSAEPLSVRAVVPSEVSQLVQLEGADSGVFVAEFHCMQWRAHKPALASPNAAGDERPTPKDAADKIIDDLEKQIEAAG